MSNEGYVSRGRYIFGDPPDYQQNKRLLLENTKYSSAISTFISNMDAAIAVGNVPYIMMHGAVMDRIFQSYHMAESIRALEMGGGTSKTPEEIRFLADASMEDHLNDKENRESIAKETLARLDGLLKDPTFEDASRDLLRQVLVMIWGAFEVLCSDVIKEIFNTRSDLAKKALDSKYMKDGIGFKGLTFDILESRSFNVSNCLGDIIIDAIKLDTLEKIRKIFELIPEHVSINKSLKNDDLWMLSQRRNLIVHRRSVVDSHYLTHTRDDRALGSKLNLPAAYVDDTIVMISKIALTMCGDWDPESASQ